MELSAEERQERKERRERERRELMNPYQAPRRRPTPFTASLVMYFARPLPAPIKPVSASSHSQRPLPLAKSIPDAPRQLQLRLSRRPISQGYRVDFLEEERGTSEARRQRPISAALSKREYGVWSTGRRRKCLCVCLYVCPCPSVSVSVCYCLSLSLHCPLPDAC